MSASYFTQKNPSIDLEDELLIFRKTYGCFPLRRVNVSYEDITDRVTIVMDRKFGPRTYERLCPSDAVEIEENNKKPSVDPLQKCGILVQLQQRWFGNKRRIPNTDSIWQFPGFKEIPAHNIMEMDLHEINLTQIPEQVFRCPNVRILSLEGNFINKISPNIGCLKLLKTLNLSDNLLTIDSFPYTMSSCEELLYIYIGKNKHLKAMPGFLGEISEASQKRRLKMKKNCRIKKWNSKMNEDYTPQVQSLRIRVLQKINGYLKPESNKQETLAVSLCPDLKTIAAKVVVTSKQDYFECENEFIKSYIAEKYFNFMICGLCETPKFEDQGYAVDVLKSDSVSFRMPYRHRACSRECAEELAQKKFKETSHIYSKRKIPDFASDDLVDRNSICVIS